MRSQLARVAAPLGARRLTGSARRLADGGNSIDGTADVGSIHASAKGLFTLVLPLRPLSPHFQHGEDGKAIRFQLHPKQPLSCVRSRYARR